MIQKGDLKRIPFPRLMQWILKNGKQGTFRFTHQATSKVLLVKGGKVIAAFSDSANEKLWMILYKTGVLDQSHLVELQQLQAQSNKRFAALLVDEQLLSAGELLDTRREQAREILLNLFDWAEGQFVYYPDRFPDHEGGDLDLDLAELLKSGMQRLKDWHDIKQRIHLEDRVRLDNAGSLNERLQRPLSSIEQHLIRFLKKDMTVKDLLAASPFNQYDTLMFVNTLLADRQVSLTSRDKQQSVDLLASARKLMGESRFWDAFMSVKELLRLDPMNLEHQQLLKECTKQLAEDLKAKFGNLAAVPKVVKDLDPELWHNLGFDAADGFIISRIDGRMNLRELFNIIKMDSKRILTTLYRLLGAGIIDIKQPVLTPEMVEERVNELMKHHRELLGQTHFQVLGVEPDATDLDIKKSYLKMVRVYHPDTLPHDPGGRLKIWSEKVFTRIQEAYQVLTGEEQRREYELSLGIRREPEEKDEKWRQRNRARTQFRIGLQSFKSRDYPRAIEYIQSAIDLNPDEGMYYAKLAEVCMKNPRWNNAGKNACTHALNLEPENPNYYCLLGLLLKQEGDLVEAEAQFRKALQIDPTNLLARREMLALGHKVKDLPTHEAITDIIGRQIQQRPKAKR